MQATFSHYFRLLRCHVLPTPRPPPIPSYILYHPCIFYESQSRTEQSRTVLKIVKQKYHQKICSLAQIFDGASETTTKRKEKQKQQEKFQVEIKSKGMIESKNEWNESVGRQMKKRKCR